MLTIKEGSVFEQKCDLLILPADSEGGITPWVQREIENNNIPSPAFDIPYGRLIFHPTEARYPKADFIAYAASVNAKTVTSDLTAIRSILIDTIDYCRINNCSIVNLPLLGTGAGGLDPIDVLAVYEELLSNKSTHFNTYVPNKSKAQALETRKKKTQIKENLEEKHPRVFISYSWKDEAVKAWALALAHELCANGVDARLDRFHLRPGMDLPQWMTNEVLKADKVLLICDSHYAEKADMRRAGVGWETMIIQGDMMLQGELNSKYIVIAFGDFEKNTPIYMKSKLGISRQDIDKNLNSLLEHIFDLDTAPEIGKIPKWIIDKRKTGSNHSPRTRPE